MSSNISADSPTLSDFMSASISSAGYKLLEINNFITINISGYVCQHILFILHKIILPIEI
jgi:hypothetical protein